MPYDADMQRRPGRSSLRAAILDIAARNAGSNVAGDDVVAELRALVDCRRDAAGDLFASYHGGRLDRHGRLFARYRD